MSDSHHHVMPASASPARSNDSALHAFVIGLAGLSWIALLLCWAIYLSLDVCALMFPWDCLLLEAGFLTLFGEYNKYVLRRIAVWADI